MAIAADDSAASVPAEPLTPETASTARASRSRHEVDSRAHVRQLFLPSRRAQGSSPAKPEPEAQRGVANEAPILD
jgi:hypothetical protein